MVDLDTEPSRPIGRLVRRYWRCFLGMPALVVVLGLPIYAFEDDLNRYVRRILIALYFVGWIACWVGCAVTWSALVRFRCPKCRKRFILSSGSLWPTVRCRHCGLDLGPSATADAKPPAEAEL